MKRSELDALKLSIQAARDLSDDRKQRLVQIKTAIDNMSTPTLSNLKAFLNAVKEAIKNFETN